MEIDTSGFEEGVREFVKQQIEGLAKGLAGAAGFILAESSFEVPHDEGILQASGKASDVTMTVKGDMFVEVGYYKKYAARLHEHPEYNFQKGRKGKYLEDPIKNNLDYMRDIIGNNIKRRIRKV